MYIKLLVVVVNNNKIPYPFFLQKSLDAPVHCVRTPLNGNILDSTLCARTVLAARNHLDQFKEMKGLVMDKSNKIPNK